MIPDLPGPGPVTPIVQRMHEYASRQREAEGRWASWLEKYRDFTQSIGSQLASGIEATPKQTREFEKLLHQNAKNEAEVERLKTDARLELMSLLKPPSSCGLVIRSANENIKRVAEDGVSFVRAVTHPSVTPKTVGVQFKTVKKDYDRPNARSKIVRIRSTSTIKTVLHELGHVLEDQNLQVQRMCQAFLKRRCKGQKAESLKEKFPEADFKANEKGRDDDFKRYFSDVSSWYIGKVYPDKATEVLSVGLETIHADPAGFAWCDPDYFDVVVRILQGQKRGRK